MAKENFFTRIFSFFRKNTKEVAKQDGYVSVELEQKNVELLKQVTNLETQVNEYKNLIDKLETQLAETEYKQLSDNEIGKKYLSLKEAYSEQQSLFISQKEVLNKLEKQTEELEKDLSNEKTKREKKENNFREKLNRKDEIISEKEEIISVKEKENKQLLVLKNNLETNCKELSEENNLKKGTIKFVQSVLNADNEVDSDYQKKHDQTFQISNYIKTEVAEVFEKIIKLKFSEGFLEKIDQWQNVERKSWIKNKRVIAIVGEFSSGKTSLVNKIVNPNNNPNIPRLPDKSSETTAIPTYISHRGGQARDFEASFLAPNKQLKKFSIESFLMVKKEFIDEVNVLSLMDYFVLNCQNENLQGITLLDTPGFASNNDVLMQKTIEAIKEASAVFWLVEAQSGTINSNSIKTIRQYLLGVPLYIIISKCDQKSPSDITAIENLIKSTMEREGIIVKEYLRFSNKEKHYLDKLLEVIKLTETKVSDKQCIKTILNKLQENKELWATKIKEKEAKNDSIYRDIQNLNSQKGRIQREISSSVDKAKSICETIPQLFEFKEKWFSSDYYKLSLENLEKFNNYNQNLYNIINSFKDQNNNHSQKEASIVSKENEMKEIDKGIRQLEDEKRQIEQVLNRLMSLLQQIGYNFSNIK